MANLMPAGVPDTFSGTTGTTAVGTEWVMPTNSGSGGSWTYQSGQGRLRTGTTQFNRSSVRVNRASLADGEMVMDFVVPAAGTMFPAIYLRAGTSVNGDGGYYFLLDHGSGQVEMGKWVPNFNGVALSSISYTFTPGVIMRIRIAIFGSRIRMRMWPAANPENTSVWDMDFTDSGTQPTTGNWGITNSSASAGSKDFFVDNFNLTDTITPTQATILVGGSITPTGALRKTAVKKFVGSVTPTGALGLMKVITRLFTGSTTPTGALRKMTLKNFTGTTTPSGALRKMTLKNFAGSITPDGSIRKMVAKRFVGSITPEGTMLRQQFGRIFGRPGIIVVTYRVVGEIRSRIRRN